MRCVITEYHTLAGMIDCETQRIRESLCYLDIAYYSKLDKFRIIAMFVLVVPSRQELHL